MRTAKARSLRRLTPKRIARSRFTKLRTKTEGTHYLWLQKISPTLATPPKTPFGDKGFVVFHKGVDGTFYKRQQATAKTILGTLPGKTDTNSNEDANTDLLPQQ